MADVERDKISEGQIEEAEQDAEDPSDEKNPAEREDDQSDNTDVNKYLKHLKSTLYITAAGQSYFLAEVLCSRKTHGGAPFPR